MPLSSSPAYSALPLTGSDAIMLPGQRRSLALASDLSLRLLENAYNRDASLALIPDLPVSSIAPGSIVPLATVETFNPQAHPPTATFICIDRLQVSRLERGPDPVVFGEILPASAGSRVTPAKLTRLAKSPLYRNQVSPLYTDLVPQALALPPSECLDQLAILLDPNALDLQAGLLRLSSLDRRLAFLKSYLVQHQATHFLPSTHAAVTTFISLLEDDHQSHQLFADLKALYQGPAEAVDFLIAPLTGAAFFAPQQVGLALWWDEYVAANANPIFLVNHSSNLPAALLHRDGLTENTPVLIAAPAAFRSTRYKDIPDAHPFVHPKKTFSAVITELFPTLFDSTRKHTEPATLDFTLNIISLYAEPSDLDQLQRELQDRFPSTSGHINFWRPPQTGAAFFQPQHQEAIANWWNQQNQDQPQEAFYLFLVNDQAGLADALAHRVFDTIDVPVIVALDHLPEPNPYSDLPGVLYFLKSETSLFAAVRELYPLSSLSDRSVARPPSARPQPQSGRHFSFDRSYPSPDSKLDPSNYPAVVAEGMARIASEGTSTNNSDTLNTVKAICWTPPPAVKLDLTKATELINRSHFGLTEVKDRILDLVATLIWSAERGLTTTPQALCLIGPPGVGKTSIAGALAEATQRRLEVISLGGVDDTFLTGTDRAYIRSRPGEIVRRLALSGKHPSQTIFFLDEIDKLAVGGRSPYPPLLALLDPEQRKAWRDQHLNEIPIDLSGALFVTTANRVEDINSPLLNRMELLTIPDYSPAEKLIIARDYILCHILEQHQLQEIMAVPDETLSALLTKYKSSTGLRSLQQGLGLITKRALRLHFSSPNPVVITPDMALGWLANSTPARTIGFRPGRTA